MDGSGGRSRSRLAVGCGTVAAALAVAIRTLAVGGHGPDARRAAVDVRSAQAAPGRWAGRESPESVRPLAAAYAVRCAARTSSASAALGTVGFQSAPLPLVGSPRRRAPRLRDFRGASSSSPGVRSSSLHRRIILTGWLAGWSSRGCSGSKLRCGKRGFRHDDGRRNADGRLRLPPRLPAR